MLVGFWADFGRILGAFLAGFAGVFTLGVKNHFLLSCFGRFFRDFSRVFADCGGNRD